MTMTPWRMKEPTGTTFLGYVYLNLYLCGTVHILGGILRYVVLRVRAAKWWKPYRVARFYSRHLWVGDKSLRRVVFFDWCVPHIRTMLICIGFSLWRLFFKLYFWREFFFWFDYLYSDCVSIHCWIIFDEYYFYWL